MEKGKYFQENAVYQIYPRSFCDSNGDGVGDLQGIVSKLDYLQSLGVGIIWLSPIYPSPNVDYGYDISNYMTVNPEFGIMADFEDLIRETKKRNIRVVMDLVVNHTSNQHPWFLASKDPKSPYADYYIWRKGRRANTLPPNNWKSVFTGSAWTFDPEAKSWYLHLFSKEQPDLNWKNPKVFQEVEKVILFWLSKGVYGFRCDVINEIYKTTLDDGVGKGPTGVKGSEHYLNQEGCHQILHHFYKDIMENRDGMVVGETPNVNYKEANKFTHEEMDMVFYFDHVDKSIPKIMFSRKIPRDMKKFKQTIIGWQNNLSWNANYLENHDQLRSIDAFGDRKKYYKQSGKMLGMMNILLRGTPFIYQGEELGMVSYLPKEIEVHRDLVPAKIRRLAAPFPIPRTFIDRLCYAHNRDNSRSPMQWSDQKNAGFTKADRPWIPVNQTYETINSDLEEADPDSILSFYKELLELRKTEEAFSYGTIDFIPCPNDVLAFTRKFDGNEFLVICNLTKHKRHVHLPSGGKLLLSNYEDTVIGDRVLLRSYECFAVRADKKE